MFSSMNKPTLTQLNARTREVQGLITQEADEVRQAAINAAAAALSVRTVAVSVDAVLPGPVDAVLPGPVDAVLPVEAPAISSREQLAKAAGRLKVSVTK